MRKLDVEEIVLATHNAGKVAEFAQLFKAFGVNIRSAADFGLQEPVEDGKSFEDNALIKARAACEATGRVSLSDDSGLCVDALGGQPGIHTADWAEKSDGSGRDFGLAMQRVEDALRAQNASDEEDRTARFVAVLCLYWPDGHYQFFRGEVDGHLVWPPVGTMGFGYDPMFKPVGFSQTFGQMPSEQKHFVRPNAEAGRTDLGLSHRSCAFGALIDQCLEPLG